MYFCVVKKKRLCTKVHLLLVPFPPFPTLSPFLIEVNNVLCGCFIFRGRASSSACFFRCVCTRGTFILHVFFFFLRYTVTRGLCISSQLFFFNGAFGNRSTTSQRPVNIDPSRSTMQIYSFHQKRLSRNQSKKGVNIGSLACLTSQWTDGVYFMRLCA